MRHDQIDELLPRVDSELPIYARRMRLHRAQRKIERLGDVRAAPALRNQAKHLDLARRETLLATQCVAHLAHVQQPASIPDIKVG